MQQFRFPVAHAASNGFRQLSDCIASRYSCAGTRCPVSSLESTRSASAHLRERLIAWFRFSDASFSSFLSVRARTRDITRAGCFSPCVCFRPHISASLTIDVTRTRRSCAPFQKALAGDFAVVRNKRGWRQLPHFTFANNARREQGRDCQELNSAVRAIVSSD